MSREPSGNAAAGQPLVSWSSGATERWIGIVWIIKAIGSLVERVDLDFI